MKLPKSLTEELTVEIKKANLSAKDYDIDTINYELYLKEFGSYLKDEKKAKKWIKKHNLDIFEMIKLLYPKAFNSYDFIENLSYVNLANKYVCYVADELVYDYYTN